MMVSRLALTAALLSLATGCSMFRGDRDAESEDVLVEEPAPGQVIEPDVERRDIKPAKIDTENWSLEGYAGILNVEDFGSEPVYGARAAYHVTEDFFLEGYYAQSTVEDSNFRRLGAPLFEDESEDITLWGLTVGYNVLPGEVFVGSKLARSSTFHFLFGAGNTDFVDEDNVTYVLGFGLRVLPVDWFSMRIEARDYIFESDILGDNEWKNNFEVSLGLGIFF